MVAPADITTSPPPERVLVITRVFDAPRELVFKAWSSPEHLAHWFGPKDFTLPFCETDFRPGGAYRLCMRGPDGKDYWVEGTYREIVEPQRIVMTWERNGADDPHPGHTLLTITLDDLGGGKTRLNLRQATFDTTEYRDGHRHGWGEAFERLADYMNELKGKERNMSASTAKASKGAFIAGWIISGLVILWMGVLGTVFFLTNRAMVEKNMGEHGYAASTVIPIQIAAVLSVILYAIPRTAGLGAILLTGYLGGAVSTHVRAGDGQWWMPVLFGVLVWLGLYLRDPRVRDFAPLRKL